MSSIINSQKTVTFARFLYKHTDVELQLIYTQIPVVIDSLDIFQY